MIFLNWHSNANPYTLIGIIVEYPPEYNYTFKKYKKFLSMTKTTYPGMTVEVSDTARLRGLTKLSILMRLLVRLDDFAGFDTDFSALTLYKKKLWDEEGYSKK